MSWQSVAKEFGADEVLNSSGGLAGSCKRMAEAIVELRESNAQLEKDWREARSARWAFLERQIEASEAKRLNLREALTRISSICNCEGWSAVRHCQDMQDAATGALAADKEDA